MSEGISEENSGQGKEGPRQDSSQKEEDNSSQTLRQQKKKRLSSEELRRQSLANRPLATMKMNLARDITKPDKKDILLGREPKSWNHEGNQRYRELILKHQNEYHAAAKRCIKTSIVASIVDMLASEGCRFLKKGKKRNTWHQVDRTACIEKVGHALRDKQSVAQQRFLRKHLKKKSSEYSDASDLLSDKEEDKTRSINCTSTNEGPLPNISEGHAAELTSTLSNRMQSERLMKLLSQTTSSIEAESIVKLKLAKDIAEGRNTAAATAAAAALGTPFTSLASATFDIRNPSISSIAAATRLLSHQNQTALSSTTSLSAEQLIAALPNSTTATIPPIINTHDLLNPVTTQVQDPLMCNTLEQHIQLLQTKRRLMIQQQQEDAIIRANLNAASSLQLPYAGLNQALPRNTIEIATLDRLARNRVNDERRFQEGRNNPGQDQPDNIQSFSQN